MSKTAIIDIDNTLWQFSDHLYLELTKIDRNFPTPDQWDTYEVWEGHCSVEEFFAVINKIHRNQDSDQHLPYPESRNFLSTLKEHDFHIIIASHRAPEMSRPTKRWLAKHTLTYDELHLSSDKSVLFPEADIVVDDSPINLEKAAESGALAVGLQFPWNAARAGNGFRLFQNLNGILEYILISS